MATYIEKYIFKELVKPWASKVDRNVCVQLRFDYVESELDMKNICFDFIGMVITTLKMISYQDTLTVQIQ